MFSRAKLLGIERGLTFLPDLKKVGQNCKLQNGLVNEQGSKIFQSRNFCRGVEGQNFSGAVIFADLLTFAMIVIPTMWLRLMSIKLYSIA